jgi:hypothetical protein
VSWDQRFAEPIVLAGGVILASQRYFHRALGQDSPTAERRMPTHRRVFNADGKERRRKLKRDE